MAIDFIADEEEKTGIDFIPDDTEARPSAPEWPLQEDTAPMVPAPQPEPIPQEVLTGLSPWERMRMFAETPTGKVARNFLAPIPQMILAPKQPKEEQPTGQPQVSPEDIAMKFLEFTTPAKAFPGATEFLANAPTTPLGALSKAAEAAGLPKELSIPGAIETGVKKAAFGFPLPLVPLAPAAAPAEVATDAALALAQLNNLKIGGVVSKGALAAFGVDWLSNQPQIYGEFKRALEEGDISTATSILGQELAMAAGIGGGALHMIRAKTPVETTIDAAGKVLPLSAEAAREIPQPPEFPPLATEAEVRAATQKGLANAEAVRSYQGQPAEAGQTIEGGEANRRSDVEQAAPVQPEPVVTREEVQAPNAPEGFQRVLLEAEKPTLSPEVTPTVEPPVIQESTPSPKKPQPRITYADLSKEKALGAYSGLTGKTMLDKSKVAKMSPKERASLVRHELAHKIEEESELWMESDTFLWKLWEQDRRHPIWDFMSEVTGKWKMSNSQSPEIIAELYAEHYPKGTFTVRNREIPYESEGENLTLPREYPIPKELMSVLDRIEDELGIWKKKQQRISSKPTPPPGTPPTEATPAAEPSVKTPVEPAAQGEQGKPQVPISQPKPEAHKAQAEVGGGAAKPFEVDEQLVMRSPHTGEDTLVSFRGLMPNGQAVVWTGKSQFPVPKEWLRRKGESYEEQIRPENKPTGSPSVEVAEVKNKLGKPIRKAGGRKTRSYMGYEIESTPKAIQVGYSTEKRLFGQGRRVGGFEVIQPDGYRRHFDTLKEAKKWIDSNPIEEPTPTPAPEAAKPAEQGPEMVGMGGARPGEVPQAPQIVQLTEELKRVDAKPVPFKEKVKEWFNLAEHRSIATDAASRAVEGMKTVRDFMINKWDGVKDWDDVKRIKGELSAEINTRGWSLRKFENEFRRAVPRLRDREALSSWLDASGDPARLQQGLAETTPRYRRSYEDALNLSPEMKGVAEHIRSYFESRLQEAIDAGVIEEGISDYIHRIYKRDTPIKQNILNRVQSGELNTRTPGLAMRRAFEYDFEAEKAGYPIEKDALKRIVDYEHSLAKVIASRKAVKQFMDIKMPDGRPMIDVAGLGVPLENAEGITEAMLIKPQFKRGDINEPGAKTYRKDYKERNDYPAFRKWKWVATDPATGRDIFVQGDVLVHPDAAARIDALLASSALRRSKVLSAALDVSSGFKQTMLDFSGFHQVQIGVHALEHRVNPFNPIKDIDLADPKVQGLLKGGLNIGGDFGGFNYREGLVGRSLSRLIPGLGDLMQSYHEYLFRDYIPRIKTTMALHALERNRARFPNMNEEQINYLTAKQANAAFGGLNYMLMERSKTAQDISRLIMLAPDFLEARGQFAAQALQRVGKGDKGGFFKGNEQRQALLLGALTLYVTARIFNKIIDGQYHFEPENAFSIVNKGHSYSLRTVQGDLLHLWDKPFQFWLNRLNPVFGRSFLELGTGRDYFGRKRSRMELAWDLLANIRPIAFRNSQERKLWESVLNAMGVQAKRWSDIDDAFTLAQDWKKANGIEERGEFIYDSEKDPLRSLKLALNHGDEAKATGEIRKLLESGYNRKKLNDYFKRYASMPFTGSKKNDIAFMETLNADQKETVNRAREHKRTIRDLYFKALGQYDAAVASGPR